MLVLGQSPVVVGNQRETNGAPVIARVDCDHTHNAHARIGRAAAPTMNRASTGAIEPESRVCAASGAMATTESLTVEHKQRWPRHRSALRTTVRSEFEFVSRARVAKKACKQAGTEAVVASVATCDVLAVRAWVRIAPPQSRQ